jgi:hypothetical protein
MAAALICSSFFLVRTSTYSSSPKYSNRRNTSSMIATNRFPQMKSRINQMCRNATNTLSSYCRQLRGRRRFPVDWLCGLGLCRPC